MGTFLQKLFRTLHRSFHADMSHKTVVLLSSLKKAIESKQTRTCMGMALKTIKHLVRNKLQGKALVKNITGN